MKRLFVIGLLLWTASQAGAVVAAPGEGSFKFQYALADFTGPIPFLGVRIRLDQPRNEVYIQQGNYFRVFGPTGMEIFSFLIDPAEGTLVDVAVDEAGDIYALGYTQAGILEGREFFLLRCDYKGEPRGRIDPAGLPAAMQDFGPNLLSYADGRFYLVSTARMAAVVLDKTGAVQRVFDLAELAALDPKIRPDAEISGFAVDPGGNLVFSIPIDFSVRVVSADGKSARRFGESGSRPGQFGVVAGVTVDFAGNIFVADRLRSVVVVYDRNQKFVTEFGGTGSRPESLVSPSDVAISKQGTLFVSQMRGRGVSVFTSSPQGDQG